MANLDLMIESMRSVDQTTDAQRNAAANLGVNPDEFAQRRAAAQSLGVPVPEDQDSWQALKMRKAAQDASRYAEVPVVRDLLADRELSKLIANSPQDWDTLSVVSQLGQAIRRGRLQSQANDAQKRLQIGATPVAVNPADLLRQGDADAFGGDEWLQDWANRPDSPLRARAAQLAAEQTARRKEATKYAAEELAQAQIEAQRLSANPALADIANADSVWDMIGIAVRHPVDTMVSTLATSVATSPTGFALAPIAGMVAGPGAAAAVMGASSFEAEYGSTFISQMEKQGVDTTNPDAVRAFMANSDLVREARIAATKRALTVGAMDALSLGAARLSIRPISSLNAAVQARRSGKTLGEAVDAGRAANRTAKTTGAVVEDYATQAVVQAAFGAGGEALGQVAIGEEINTADVFLEAIADLATAPVDMISARNQIRRVAQDQSSAKSTLDSAAVVEEAFNRMETTGLAQRAPDVAARAVQSVFQGTPLTDVIINAREAEPYMDKLRELMPDAAKVLTEAEATGADIKVPLAKVFELRLKDKSLAENVMALARFDRDGMSIGEARAYDATGELELAVNQLATATVEGYERKRERMERARTALAPVAEKLRAAGRSEEEVQSSVAIQASILENMAEMAGVEPDAFFKEHGFTVNVEPTPKPEGFLQTTEDGVRRTSREEHKADVEAWREDTSPVERRTENRRLRERKKAILGSYTPTEKMIRLFKNEAAASSMNASTFLHESAHYWLDTMLRTAKVLLEQQADSQRPISQQSERLLVLTSKFMQWGGAYDPKKDLSFRDAVDRWLASSTDEQRAFQEKFARGMEAYIKEGKAPAEGLQKVFEQFAAWLKEVYVTLRRTLDVELSPEVASLYDQLFVSEQAVQDARDRWNDASVFDPLVKAGMSEDDFRSFVDLRELARQQAEGKIRKNLTEDMKLGADADMRKRRGLEADFQKMRRDAQKLLLNEPHIKAYQYFIRPTKQDGKTIRRKIDADTIKNLPEETQKALIDSHAAMERGKANVEYLTLGEAAMTLGAESPEALADRIVAGSKVDLGKAADEAARSEFLQKYGAAYSPEAIAQLASTALNNDARLRVLSIEVAALKGMAGKAPQVNAAMKAFARSAVGRMVYARYNERSGRWQPIRSYPFISAARRASKAALTAFGKGQTSEAADAKHAQLAQEMLASEVERARALGTRFNRRVKAALKTKTVGGEYAEQIHKFAARLGFNAQENKAAASWKSFVEKHDNIRLAWENLSEDTQAALLRGGQDWPSMQVRQIEELNNFFGALTKDGSLEKKGRELEKTMELYDTIREGIASITANADAVKRGHFNSSITETRPGAKFKRGFTSFIYAHIPGVAFVQALDGNKQGFLTRTLIWRQDECSNREQQLKAEFGAELTDLLSPVSGHAFNSDFREIEDVGRMNLHNIMAVVLNMGNEGNAKRLETGNGLDREKQMRIAEELTAEQLQTVNKVWAVMEKLRKLAAEMSRRATGTEPLWIEPTPFTVTSKDGVEVQMTGGYVPIKYDKHASMQKLGGAYTDDDAVNYEAALKGVTEMMTLKTYTKARAGDAPMGSVLRLDVRGVFDGAEEVVRDVCWREYLADFKRIMEGIHIPNPDYESQHAKALEKYNAAREAAERAGLDPDTVKLKEPPKTVFVPGILNTVRDRFGEAGVQVLDNTAKAIATGGRPANTGAADRASALMRQGVSLAGLGFNLTTALIQVTGLITAAPKVGVKHVLAGIGDLMAHPVETWQEINRRSVFMRARQITRTRELADARNVLEKGGRYTKIKGAVYDVAYAPMMAVQGVVDHVVWGGAFRRALEVEGLSETDAVKYADRVVRDTQGSGLVSDSAAIENGSPIQRLFMVFYSFMGRALGLTAMSYLGEHNRAKAYAQILTISLALPMIESVIRGAIQPGDDDDKWDRMTDAEKFTYGARYALGSSAGFMLGQFFLAREFSSMTENFFKGDPVFSWRGPSGLRAIADAGQFLSQAQQGEIDVAFSKALINLAGDFGMPGAAQLQKSIAGWQALEKGDTDNWLALLLGYKK